MAKAERRAEFARFSHRFRQPVAAELTTVLDARIPREYQGQLAQVSHYNTRAIPASRTSAVLQSVIAT